jgi:hypothetical protein
MAEKIEVWEYYELEPEEFFEEMAKKGMWDKIGEFKKDIMDTWPISEFEQLGNKIFYIYELGEKRYSVTEVVKKDGKIEKHEEIVEDYNVARGLLNNWISREKEKLEKAIGG